MSTKTPPSAASDAPAVEVPGQVGDLAREHPALWQAFQRLGQEVSRAGPLDARTCRLIHLAFAIAVGSEGAAHSHARRALADGIDAKDLDHVALLGITTLGWAQAVKGLTWVRDVTRSG